MPWTQNVPLVNRFTHSGFPTDLAIFILATWLSLFLCIGSSKCWTVKGSAPQVGTLMNVSHHERLLLSTYGYENWANKQPLHVCVMGGEL